jgi:hypothetical protein
MTAQLLHHREPGAADFTLNCAANVIHAISGSRAVGAVMKGSFGTLRQRRGDFGYFSNANRDRRVGDKPILLSRKIELDQVAQFEAPAARYAMNGFVIHTNTSVARKPIHFASGRFGFVRRQLSRRDLVQFRSGDTRLNRRSHGVQSSPNDLSDLL